VALASLSRSRRPGVGFQESSVASLHGRALLLPDDVIRPGKGHATVFAAYGEGGRAEQSIFHAELTPFFRRRDWKLDKVQPQAPVTLPKPARPRASAPQTAAAPPAPEQAEPPAEAADDQDQQIVAQVEEALAQELEIEV